jgi:stage II sporulation protein D
MPRYWEPEAPKAQAIAARTYCFYIKKRFGGNRKWDMKKTAAHQVYRGVSAESTEIWNIVNQTKGQVLVCKQTDGTEDIFPTYYSSVCGGYTENSKNVFGDSFEPLISVPCPYCKNVAKPKFFFWPMIQFDNAYVVTRLLRRYPNLKKLGEIINISPAAQSNYAEFSRLTKVKLSGSNGKSDFLRAEDFRLAIDPTGRKLRSAICQIVKRGDKWAFLSGRGWGHGVGMCQCGAQGMARKGKNAQQILSYYYPGSKILTIDYLKKDFGGASPTLQSTRQ